MVTTMRVVGIVMLVSVWTPICEPNLNYYAWLACQIVSGYMISVVGLVFIWGDYFKSQVAEKSKTLDRVKIRRLGRGIQPAQKSAVPPRWLQAAE